MIDYTQIDAVIDSIPALKEESDARAIATHVISCPSIIPPKCSPDVFSSILDALGKRQGRGVKRVKYIDLLAGIGGFHQALSSLNAKCVFSSEWDPEAKKTYAANYGLVPYGDITKISADEIPDHDVLCAGFSRQPFSIAGVSKKNSMGRATGFEDKTQGTLFF